MKLLFDHNLSPRLIERLADLYPNSEHGSRVGLEKAPDAAIWRSSQENAFTIVTKDADFGEMSVLLHFPPKVIWLRMGNCSTVQIETILRAQYETVKAFHIDPKESVLALF